MYVHFEAPDECGHRNEPENKVKAIEMIDSRVLPILEEGLEQYEDYKILLLPDHPTPIVTRTHASDPVPYLLYQKSAPKTGVDTINEETAKHRHLYGKRPGYDAPLPGAGRLRQKNMNLTEMEKI